MADCGRRPGPFSIRRDDDNTTSRIQRSVATTPRNHAGFTCSLLDRSPQFRTFRPRVEPRLAHSEQRAAQRMRHAIGGPLLNDEAGPASLRHLLHPEDHQSFLKHRARLLTGFARSDSASSGNARIATRSPTSSWVPNRSARRRASPATMDGKSSIRQDLTSVWFIRCIAGLCCHRCEAQDLKRATPASLKFSRYRRVVSNSPAAAAAAAAAAAV